LATGFDLDGAVVAGSAGEFLDAVPDLVFDPVVDGLGAAIMIVRSTSMDSRRGRPAGRSGHVLDIRKLFSIR
jgi:hypothetical protein